MGPKYCFDYWHSYQKESDMVFSEACSENQTISADLIWLVLCTEFTTYSNTKVQTPAKLLSGQSVFLLCNMYPAVISS